MKILVGIKRVVDYNVRIRVKSDGSGVDTDGVKMSINPFDEIALEQALRIREAGQADEVIVVSLGDNACQQQLRTGLAMGADRAIQVDTSENLQPLTIARTFIKVIEKEQPGLVILGKQAIDADNSQTAQMIAALWDRPQATFASEMNLSADSVSVTREVDAGLETIEVDLPAVISVDLRLNEPRYASLPNIMKAKKKELKVIPLVDTGVDASPRTELLKVELPEARAAGIMVDSVDQLVDKLKNEAKVIS